MTDHIVLWLVRWAAMTLARCMNTCGGKSGYHHVHGRPASTFPRLRRIGLVSRRGARGPQEQVRHELVPRRLDWARARLLGNMGRHAERFQNMVGQEEACGITVVSGGNQRGSWSARESVWGGGVEADVPGPPIAEVDPQPIVVVPTMPARAAEEVPRRTYLKQWVFDLYGPSPGCEGCLRAGTSLNNGLIQRRADDG